MMALAGLMFVLVGWSAHSWMVVLLGLLMIIPTVNRVEAERKQSLADKALPRRRSRYNENDASIGGGTETWSEGPPHWRKLKWRKLGSGQ